IEEMVMPIRPENRDRYPANWATEIRPRILARAGNCCEGSPDFPHCRAHRAVRRTSRMTTRAFLIPGGPMATHDIIAIREVTNRTSTPKASIKLHLRGARGGTQRVLASTTPMPHNAQAQPAERSEARLQRNVVREDKR